MEVMIITGMSGAGKTKAVDWFEDQKYYCIDNMPPTLIKNFIDLSISSKKVEKAAFVADIRSGTFFAEIENIVDELKKMNKKGIVIFYIDGFSDATGHATIWDGVKCLDGSTYYDPSLHPKQTLTAIKFWDLK